MGEGSAERERRVVDAFEHIWQPPDEASLLLVNDRNGELEQRLSATGLVAGAWSRWSDGARRGQSWPKAKDYSGATLRLPGDKSALGFTLEAVASVLGSGASLWVYGASDEGVKSVSRHLEPWYTDAVTLGSKHRCRVIHAVRTDAPARCVLPEYLVTKTMITPEGPRPWVHLPGVFAKGELDQGTALLLAALKGRPRAKGRVLDFACGGGVIGAALETLWPKTTVYGLDADAIAVEVAHMNANYEAIDVCDSFHGYARGSFSAIISNPPFHKGKSEDRAALYAVIEEGRRLLKSGGVIWLVVQKRLGLGRQLSEERFGAPKRQCLEDDGRYQVWCLRW